MHDTMSRRSTAGAATTESDIDTDAPAKPKRRGRSSRLGGRDPWWARLLVIFGALLMVGSGVAVAAANILADLLNKSVHQESLLPEDDGGSIDGPLNMLLIGLDERADNPAAGIRADSIIIVHINATHDQAYLTSIPRDSEVDIPSYPKNGYGGGREKINAAFQHGSENGGGRDGGVKLLIQTIKRLVPGIRFNAAAIVNFDGFKGLVDALGGVRMCVDEKVTSIHIGFDKNGKYAKPYYISPDGVVGDPIWGVTPQQYFRGCQDMTSWQALDYCRQRELLELEDGDYGRQRHQQQFIKAVMQQAVKKGLSNPTKIKSIMSAAGAAFTFDGGGPKIEDWFVTLRGINPNSIVMIKTNAGKYASARGADGSSVEILSEDSKALLRAVRDDKVADFAAAHSDWVSSDS